MNSKIQTSRIGSECDNVSSMAWSPDGSKVVIGSQTTIRIVDSITDTDTGVHFIGNESGTSHDSRIESVAWSPDGGRIISGSRDSIRVWMSNTGEMVKKIIYDDTVVSLMSIEWSPDGRMIAAGVNNTVRVWNSYMESEQCVFHGHTLKVDCVVWSPDGTKLASSSGDNTIRIWCLPKHLICLEKRGCTIVHDHLLIQPHDEKITGVCWSPCGKMIASGAWDGSVCISDPINGDQIKQIMDHDDYVSSIDWCYNGDDIVIVSIMGICRVLSFHTGRTKKTILDASRYNTHDTTYRCMSSSNGDILVLAQNGHSFRISNEKVVQ